MNGYSWFVLACLIAAGSAVGLAAEGAGVESPRPWITARGIYGGSPTAIFQQGKTLRDYGVNAVWIGSGRLNEAVIERLRCRGRRSSPSSTRCTTPRT